MTRIPEATMLRIVAGIEAGDPAASEELLTVCELGIRFLVSQRLKPPNPSDVDDILHDVMLETITRVRAGSLRAPLALMGYMRKIADARINIALARKINDRAAGSICERVRFDRGPGDVDYITVERKDPNANPERDVLIKQRVAGIREALAEMRPSDREVLTRFYLHEQTRSEVCAAMGLTLKQFNNLKCRALDRVKCIAESRQNERRMQRMAA